MKYFVENGFTFLCVKVSPAEGSKAVESFGELPPLHLSFRSEKMYYPLRFSSRQGAFDLQLVTLTEKPIDYRASAESLRQLGWNDRSHRRNVGVSTGDLPPELLSLVRNRKHGERVENWYVNLINCQRVNGRVQIATWKQDIFFDKSRQSAAGVGHNRPWNWTILGCLALIMVALVTIRGRYRSIVPTSL